MLAMTAMLKPSGYCYAYPWLPHAIQRIAQQQTQSVGGDLCQGLGACVCALRPHAFLERKAR